MADGTDKVDSSGSSQELSEQTIVADNWSRYDYVRSRGHDDFCKEVRRLEDYVLGGGKQWEEDDKKALEGTGRMPLEFNQILPAIKAAGGYQISNRMDISYQPRGGQATQDLANTLSKVSMQIADNNEYHWTESQVFLDGLIQRRGFFEIRIDFDDSMRGEVRIDDLDPMDVLPDPDAKSYDSDKWADVIVTRWLSLDDIGRRYGAKAKAKAELDGTNSYTPSQSESDFGDGDGSAGERNKFGDSNSGAYYNPLDAKRTERGKTKLRVVDRQYFVYEMCQVIVTPDTGDIRVVEGMDQERIDNMLSKGGILTQRMSRRVRWTVTTCNALLFDDWSPYPFFTVVGYFPFFRRGRSIGMVDNAVGPQNALNKLGSQFIHVVNSSANSGWVVEEDSLVDQETSDLETNGAKTGIVLVYKKGSSKPEKIQPNQVPTGIDRMIDRLNALLKENTVPDAARGIDDNGPESGVARQAREYAAQKQLAMEIDNLSRTRKLLVKRQLWMIQTYYDDERLYRITKIDPVTGKPKHEDLRINYEDPATGNILNDLTLGEYDVVISQVPMQATFENGDFDQVMRMKENGVGIPDAFVVRASTVTTKNDIVQSMSEQTVKPDPVTEAKVELIAAQTRKTDAEATSKSVETQFSAIQTAQVIAEMPATAPLADQLLGSAGYVDHDAAPIIPNAPPGIDHIELPRNTNPLTPLNPAHADVGVNAGIEGGQQ
ncbi:MAG: genomic island protein [Pseudomonadota bacterium]